MKPDNHQDSPGQQQAGQKPERRVKPRTRLHIKADVTLPGDLTIVGHTLDISAGGMSLEVPYSLEPGQRCEIELNLAKLGGPSWVQVVAEVRHCTEVDNQCFEAGLQFVDMPVQTAELLETYVWSRLAAK
jgi:c-di-GMP-binding flagellar brake protein YcgR